MRIIEKRLKKNTKAKQQSGLTVRDMKHSEVFLSKFTVFILSQFVIVPIVVIVVVILIPEENIK